MKKKKNEGKKLFFGKNNFDVKILHRGKHQVTHQLQWDCVVWVDLGIEGGVNF